MSRFKVVIADPPAAEHDIEAQALDASGLSLETVWLNAREPERILEHADADALVMSWVPMTRHVIDQLERCQVIARFGIGVDMIDLEAATERGILVCNTATYCLDEVSNHAMGLLLMLSRGLLWDVDSVRQGGWFRSGSPPPRRLAGQTLGLVGLGNIGRLVAHKARGFGLRVVACDPYVRRTRSKVDDVPLLELEQVLRESDFLSIHCPLNPSTRHLIGDRELGLMKPSAYLVNTARGAIVDQAALTRVLAEHRIAGAGLDVFEVEPLPADDPLRALDNVILTPHSASWSVESSLECRRVAVEHAVSVLRGEIPPDVVNRAVLNRPRSSPGAGVHAD